MEDNGRILQDVPAVPEVEFLVSTFEQLAFEVDKEPWYVLAVL